MKRQKTFHFILMIGCLFIGLSCSNDKLDEPDTVLPITKVVDGTQGKAEYFDLVKVHTSYILVNDAQSNSVYLMDKDANLVHNWNLNGGRLGNDAFLLPNGKLLAMLEVEDPGIDLGGFAGKIQLLDKEGKVEWNFEYASENYILHHDAELLPNGNILTMIWERKSLEEAQMAGSRAETELIVDGLIEIDPSTDEIIWEWHVWDHWVQDHDPTSDNFGDIAQNPQLVDLNFVEDEKGDITHANGIAYDPDADVIYLSVNFYDEVWVIDHSTTTTEAATHSGGTYNKGGDILYRFGNPKAYKNNQGTSLFDRNHFPNLLDGQYKGNMLIFANGATIEQSTVYELKIPTAFFLQPDADNEPEVVWSFTDEDLFAPRVSGAVRLPNGNTLITEGDFGIWEVTEAGEVVWQFSAAGFFWRAYSFDVNSPAIQALDLP